MNDSISESLFRIFTYIHVYILYLGWVIISNDDFVYRSVSIYIWFATKLVIIDLLDICLFVREVFFQDNN